VGALADDDRHVEILVSPVVWTTGSIDPVVRDVEVPVQLIFVPTVSA
jgi:hypothetical protein